MTLTELKRLAAKGESDRLEFKRTTGTRNEAAKTVCAMLNGLGGFVIFGVGDKGELLGQEIGQRTVEEVTNELARIEPPAFPEIETVAFKQNLSFIVLRVPGGGGLFNHNGHYYLRVGPTTRPMPRHEYERRLMERLHATTRWENQPVPDGVTIADLDAEEIRATLRNAIDLGRLTAPRSRDLKSILRGLELIHNGKLLNAAVALYGKSERLHILYPQMSVRLARFRGVNRLADFTDNRQYWGHAFDLLRRAETFLLDHVPIAGRVVEGKMRREDRPAYPPRATREALANAICHRDYTAAGGAIAVAMYDEHLEIVNPGGFHLGIEPAKLVVPHESKPWNPIIAGVFYRAGVIERWGMGTLKILDWCKEFDCPQPEWKEQAGSVYVTFKPAEWFEKQRAAGQLTPEVTPEATPEATPEVAGEVTGEVAGEVTGEVAKLLKVLTMPLTRSAMQSAVGLRGQANFRDRYLKPALDLGVVEMTIPDKPQSRFQRYRLTAKGRAVLERLKAGTTN